MKAGERFGVKVIIGSVALAGALTLPRACLDVAPGEFLDVRVPVRRTALVDSSLPTSKAPTPFALGGGGRAGQARAGASRASCGGWRRRSRARAGRRFGFGSVGGRGPMLRRGRPAAGAAFRVIADAEAGALGLRSRRGRAQACAHELLPGRVDRGELALGQLGASGLPVVGCEIQHTVHGPVWHQAEHLLEVLLRVQVVEDG